MKFILSLSFIVCLSIQMTSISELVEAIAKNGSLSFDQDAQYSNFEQLLEVAYIEDLIQLTDHDAPAVRGYAFWGLAKKNYEGLEDIFRAHIDDRAKVISRNGCLVGDNTVIGFMRQVVTPYMYDPHCKKLSDDVRALVQ